MAERAPQTQDADVTPQPLTLPGVFADNMVLQRDAELPVWGTAEPGERVTVEFRGQSATAVANDLGRWRVKLGPFDAGGPFEMAVAAGPHRHELRNVLVGEVWLAAGQSNMAMKLEDLPESGRDITSASFPTLRLATVAPTVADEPRDDTPVAWANCGPRAAAEFSAIGYLFARELMLKLNVPVGVVTASRGASPAESWMSRDALASDPDFAPIVKRYRESRRAFPDRGKTYEAAFAQWEAEAEKAEREGMPLPGAQPRLIGPGSAWTPSGLWHGMICPLRGFAMRGVIFYHGEAAPERAHQYRKLFPALVGDWRRAWGIGDFPFYYVQLAGFGPMREGPGDSSWAELREAQRRALKLPNTGMAVAIDAGDERTVHPRHKRPIADRLLRLALAKTYGFDVPWSGPEPSAIEVRGDKVLLTFKLTYGGLVAQGGEPLRGFVIAGDDRRFFKADAAIEGNSVRVSSPEARRPVAVRYGWRQHPICNLFNAAGLPASPFRSDRWPGITRGVL